ncbi:MAG TPA: 4Fe-4S binding protein [Spirochaetia bacterium]|nr:4Fe-4S binding protein [Spirochaetia bacterium]
MRCLLGPVACVFDATPTGVWRIERPEAGPRCNYCGICAMYCPPGVINTDKEERLFSIDWDYCKGCGICANVCPHDNLTMVPERGTAVG